MDLQQSPTHHARPHEESSNPTWCSSCSTFKTVTLRNATPPESKILEPKRPVYPLSPIDMLMPRMHVPKLLYFATTAEPADITSNLRAALALTLKTIPIIAGSVAVSRQQGDQKGSLSVQSPYFEAEDIVSSKDLRHQYDYKQLQAAHFSSDAIAFDAIAPKQFEEAADSTPVMLAQANFLRGGLLLFFAVHHCVLDEVGLFNVMKIWSSCCRGDVGLEFVTPQWFDQTSLWQGAGSGRLEDHPEYTLAPEGGDVRAAEDPSAFYPSSENVSSATFFFSDESLGRLKIAAGMPDGNDGRAWISTNDALIALCWCCITSARLAESTNPTDAIFSLFAMAVNGRSQLQPPMSPDYCGNVVLIAKTLAKADDLLFPHPGRLAKVASLIRRAVNVVDDGYVRDVIQMVRNVDDVGRLAPRKRPATEYTLICSTWARQPYYSLDWGKTVGGNCERVRCRRIKTDGAILIFPRLPSTDCGAGESDRMEGGIEVQLSMQSGHLERLTTDPIFTEFAQWRCR